MLRFLPATSNRARHRRQAHSRTSRLFGKLAFFTALGVPDVIDDNGDSTFDVPLRSIDPLLHRNKASGQRLVELQPRVTTMATDGVTWIFETGPRQTIPLEGTFCAPDLNDQRLLNWSACGARTRTLNNNARGIQGGKGFATRYGA